MYNCQCEDSSEMCLEHSVLGKVVLVVVRGVSIDSSGRHA